MPNEDLIMLANKFGADELVIPDVLGDRMGTLRKTVDFLAHPAVELWQKNLMAVVQGTTWADWKDCIDFYVNEPRITTIALPRLLTRHGGQYTRLTLAEEIANKSTKAVHCLGASAWVEEVYYLNVQSIVRSLDTSLPYVFAKALQPLSLRRANKYIDRGDHDVYFHQVLTNEQFHFMEANRTNYLYLAQYGLSETEPVVE